MSAEQKPVGYAPTRVRQKVNKYSKNTKWSKEEDELFQKLMKNTPKPDWSELVSYFPGKTAVQIEERWEKVINPTLIKGSWTPEEDETIINFVAQYGVKNWTKLAEQLPGRIGKQCRERWRNHLDPNVNTNPFTPEEDAILIELHEKLGNAWVKISEQLPGRSDNAVKNRWNSTLKKRLEKGIGPDAPKPKRGRPSGAHQAPRSADDVPKPPRFDEIVIENVKAASPNPTPLYTPSLNSPFGLRSPFGALKSPAQLKSPFGLVMSPMMSGWSPSRDFESQSLFSPKLFSPKLFSDKDENVDTTNLSPVLFEK